MLKRIIDKRTGVFLRDDFEFNDTTEIILDIKPSEGLNRPRWTGVGWIEDMTQEEIDELNRPHMKEPTTEEYLLDLDFRLACLELGI